jgi:hypothetical protein
MSSSRTELARSLVVYASVIFLALFLSWILVVAGKSTYIVVPALAVTARGVMFVLSRRTGRNASERFQELAAGVARLLTRIHIVHIFWIAVVLRLGLAMFYNVEPISDFKKFFDHASAMSGGDLSVLNDSKSPLTVLWYGSLFRVLGASMVVVHCTNALLGGLQALLVYRITYAAFASRAPGHAAALVVAVLPSLVLFSAHPSSEMPSAGGAGGCRCSGRIVTRHSAGSRSPGTQRRRHAARRGCAGDSRIRWCDLEETPRVGRGVYSCHVRCASAADRPQL